MNRGPIAFRLFAGLFMEALQETQRDAALLVPGGRGLDGMAR